MERISDILRNYISERIPQTATNILFQLFNGVYAAFQNLEYRFDYFKRERNILTATKVASLRNLAAQNGFEPTLAIPAKGILHVSINPKLFNRVGYPLFIKPYTVFTDKVTKIQYVYVGDRTIKLDATTNTYVPVIEGVVKSIQLKSKTTLNSIQRFYIEDDYIADNSMIVEVNGEIFDKVNSFYDSKDDKCWMLKYSAASTKHPMVLYIRGLSQNQIVTVTYRLTNGTSGNISAIHMFEIDELVDSFGNDISLSDDEISIVNSSGFLMGSNGTDETTLRSSIGFNHGINLLFDNTSYRNFINKYSTVRLQTIEVDESHKQINNIYVWKTINLLGTQIDEYRKTVENEKYQLPADELDALRSVIKENEYCLSSSNLNKARTNKYSFQIMFNNVSDKNNHSEKIRHLLYSEFIKFLNNVHHQINIETLFETYQKENNVVFRYIIFSEEVENKKFQESKDAPTPYIISQKITDKPTLPLLTGNFYICDSSNNKVKLFTDINFVVVN